MKKTYTVKVKHPRNFFWTTIKNVRGDGIQDRFRWFLTAKGELFHFPMDVIVWFAKEREDVILKEMNKAAGQTVIKN